MISTLPQKENHVWRGAIPKSYKAETGDECENMSAFAAANLIRLADTLEIEEDEDFRGAARAVKELRQ